jgi:hypothetical protein
MQAVPAAFTHKSFQVLGKGFFIGSVRHGRKDKFKNP